MAGSKKKLDRDWRQYETYIHKHLARVFPDADIQHDVKRVGVISKTRRQIDILITQPIAGFNIEIVVDCKYFSRRLNVGDVEKFISFIGDLKASKGVLIPNAGYSKAAYNRATYDSRDVEIRIVDFSDLPLWSTFLCLSHSGTFGAFISAPPGWIIDLVRPQDVIAFLYLAGTDEDEILRSPFIYLMVWHKDEAVHTLEQLDRHQRENLQKVGRAPRVESEPGPERSDEARTILRVAEMVDSEYLDREVSCLVDYEEAMPYFVLRTYAARQEKDTRSLVWMVEKYVALKMIYSDKQLPAAAVVRGGQPVPRR